MVVSMVICNVFAEFLLESICAPTSTLSTLEVATKVERLMMGKFVSAALFELGERFRTLPQVSSTDELCAEVITLTISHSILQRSNGIRAIGKLTSTLLKGSFLYALSLLGMCWFATLSLFHLTVLQVISFVNIVSFALPVRSFHAPRQGNI